MKGERILFVIFTSMTILVIASFFIYNTAPSSISPDSVNTPINQTVTDNTIFDSPLQTSVSDVFTSGTNSDSQKSENIRKIPWISDLYGIRLKGTAGNNMAVIVNRDGTQERIVHVDDTVGKATIHTIKRNTLVLTGPLGRDVLVLPAGETAHQQGQSSESDKNPTGNLRVVEREILQNMLSEIDRLSEEITLQPVRSADGSPGGFRITSLKPLGLMAQMGLRRNDILVSVNQKQIVSVEDVYRVLESATHLTTLSLRIDRHNQKMELNYVLR